MTQPVQPQASRNPADVAARANYAVLYGPPLQRAFTAYRTPRSRKGGDLRYGEPRRTVSLFS